MIDLWTLLTSDVTLCWTWEVKRASQSAAAFVLVIRGEQQPLVYASSYILPTHTHTHSCTPYRTYLSSWHILERDNCFSSLTSCCGTPGLPICTRLHLDVVKTPAHRHLHGQHATDGEIKCTVNAWMLVTYGKLLRCGDNMRGWGEGALETLWAFIWISMLVLKLKGSSLVSNRRLWWCKNKSFLPPFPRHLSLPVSSWENIFPHCDRSEHPFCRDFGHFNHRVTQPLYGFPGGQV